MAPRGQGLSPRRGTFWEILASSPEPRGHLPRSPSDAAGVGKVAAGAWDGLGGARFCGLLVSRARVPSPGFKAPAWTPGPRRREVQLCPRSARRGARCPWPRDDLAVRAPAPAPAPRLAMGGSLAGPRAAGQVLGEGGLPRKLCRAVTTRPAGRRACPLPPPAECGRGSPLRAGSSPRVPAARPLPRASLPRCGVRCLPGRWGALRSGCSSSRSPSLPAVAK